MADIPHIMAIERQVFSPAWTSGIYQRELTANPFSHYFVIRPYDHTLTPVLAYGGVWQMDESAHIPTIAAHPNHTRRKLSSYLLLNLLILGQELGCTDSTLELRASNEPAQRLYERHGFEIVGRRRRYYRDNNEDALIMTRPSLEPETLKAELATIEAQLRSLWLHPVPQT